MKTLYPYSLLLFGCLLWSCKSSTENTEKINIPGLNAPVEILRDQWGINHIYAENQEDLFFAQGYAAAKDRLFQFEIWRRQATGTVAEMLGSRALKRDIGTRLFKYRGDMQDEMNYYHEDGVAIIEAYTHGVNAYIDEVLKQPEELPIEFKLLGLVPQKWTPEVVISRHQGLLGNIDQELNIGRAVATIGPDAVKNLIWFHPRDPNITLDPSITKEVLALDILELYQAYRKGIEFEAADLLPKYASKISLLEIPETQIIPDDSHAIGSNNWVISGSKMKDGNTYMANDPHRKIAIPSLRYMVHLNAPGWDVIGGGEPEIPGISIGHNTFGTWGLTVYSTDGEDLYIYDINPENHRQYRHNNEWVDMHSITETIQVKDQADVEVQLNYSLHGPITLIDTIGLKAYAVKCAWLEPGGAPYLASLRMDQAKSWEEFRAACNYSHIPGENMIWADQAGNIGWQAVGIAPIRNNFSGLVPVPGNGTYEWDGYLPIIEKPNTFNPAKGFIATANQNVTPESYTHWNAIGYTWSDPFRGNRIDEVLSPNDSLTLEDLTSLQVDYLSLPARALTPMLLKIPFQGRDNKAKSMLEDWDYRLDPHSIEAAIYTAFERELERLAHEQLVPTEVQSFIIRINLTKLIGWLSEPTSEIFGSTPEKTRTALLTQAFQRGVESLTQKLGPDMNQWQYGQAKLKHTYLKHALGKWVDEKTQKLLNLGPLSRGGNAYTVGSTGSDYQQRSGASFRMIINTGDWDAAIATNGPGQSGNPASPFYNNLFEPWSQDRYFPVYFDRSKIEAVTVHTNMLMPSPK